EAWSGNINFILLYNVNGFNHPIKRKKIFNALNAKQCNIAFLQETGRGQRNLRGWVGAVFSSSYSNKARGVAILIRKNIPFKELKVVRGEEGRSLILLLEIMSQRILDPQFFHRLNTKLQQFGNIPIILGGNFNEALDLQLDHLVRVKPHSSGTNKAVHTLISELILVSHSLVGDTLAATIDTQLFSDHAPISFVHMGVMGLETSKKWRLNVSLPQNAEPQADIRNSISDFLRNNVVEGVEDKLLWDSLKAVLRGRLISYASKCKKEKMIRVQKLEEEIGEREKCLKQQFSLNEFYKLQSLKYEFNILAKLQSSFKLNKASLWKYIQLKGCVGKVLSAGAPPPQTPQILHIIKTTRGLGKSIASSI
uniref:Endonuclease/exonuclease/phosphatase domain-containing protein n=1 Tax=Latimeria chalumnae TaxID=7897 RepID=H3BA49_LATCH